MSLSSAVLAPEALSPEARPSDELEALVRLHAALLLYPHVLSRLLACWGGAASVLGAGAAELSRDGALGLGPAESLLRAAAAHDAPRELETLRAMGGRVLAYGTPGYPALLQSSPDAPALLYALGDPDLSAPSLAVVGTRHPTPYGRRAAAQFAGEAAGRGLAVVSGLARGVDTVAHRAALDAGGRTWAVLGSGFLKPYPAENAGLLREIARAGAVLSEFPLDAGPQRHHFPRRNRVISGLSLGTLVVEGEMTSGALITAKRAIEQGREVFAVPGPIGSPMSRAPHYLLRQGAKLAETIDDVLEELPLPSRPAAAGPPSRPPRPRVTEEESRVLEAVGEGERSADELVEALGWDAARVNRILFELELSGGLRQGPGLRYARS